MMNMREVLSRSKCRSLANSPIKTAFSTRRRNERTGLLLVDVRQSTELQYTGASFQLPPSNM